MRRYFSDEQLDPAIKEVETLYRMWGIGMFRAMELFFQEKVESPYAVPGSVEKSLNEGLRAICRVSDLAARETIDDSMRKIADKNKENGIKRTPHEENIEK